MKIFRFSSCIILIAAVFLQSCSDDEVKVPTYENGVFVVNEGNFGPGNGTISFYDPVSGEVVFDLFGKANKGKALGDVVQSMYVEDEVAYIVVNNDKKIEVVDATTFQSIKTIGNLQLPRYFTTAGGKGYFTEWVNFSDPGRVSVLNLTTYEVEETITTDYGAENLIASNGKLYVSNNFSSTVTIIDISTASIIETIEVGSAPGQLVVDSDGDVWVICGGGSDTDWNPLNNGVLVEIDADDDAVKNTVELQMNVPVKLVNNSDVLYFIKGNSIYQYTIADDTFDILHTITTSSGLYGIGYNEDENLIYASDANGFLGAGTVYRMQTDGTEINNFSSGIGPNSFYFLTN